MKRALLVTGLAVAVLYYTGCRKRNDMTLAEENAIGQYTFEKVVINDGLFDNKNITQQYHNLVLQLNDKKEAAIVDQTNSITYFGKYDIVEQVVYNNDDDGSNTEVTIIIDIKTPSMGNRYHMVGEDANIGRHKMRFTVKRADGDYRFRLNKI